MCATGECTSTHGIDRAMAADMLSDGQPLTAEYRAYLEGIVASKEAHVSRDPGTTAQQRP